MWEWHKHVTLVTGSHGGTNPGLEGSGRVSFGHKFNLSKCIKEYYFYDDVNRKITCKYTSAIV